MAKPEVRSASEIVTINPYLAHSFSYLKNEIKPNTLEKSSRNAFFISYIQTRDIITATVDISANVPESDLKDAIEIKVYDELALDSSIEYKITYLETDAKEVKNRSFNIFAIDQGLLHTKYAPIQEKIHYIDFMTTAPFLLKSLYRKNLLESQGVHCFIYFQKNDAFLSLYKNGQYIYSKSLHYALSEINEKFCELLGERIDDEDFFRLLASEGLNTSNEVYQSFLMQLFGDIFSYLSDVILFAKRSYTIDTIDKIYIGSEVGLITGIDGYCKSYLGIEALPFQFNIAINTKEWYIDQMHNLMVLTAQMAIENPDEELNFSPFRRPPPFKERPSGKLTAVVLASLLVGCAFPLYQLGYGFYLNVLLAKDTQEYNTLFVKTSSIRDQLAALKSEKEKVDTLVKAETSKFDFRKKLLDEIYMKKLNYPMKAKMLIEIFELSQKSRSKVKTLHFGNNTLALHVRNHDDKRITEFLQDLTALKRYAITTDKIAFDEELGVYVSTILIGLRP